MGQSPENESQHQGMRVMIGPTTSLIPANNDDTLLEHLGLKAELKRDFSPFQLFCVSFSIMSIAPSVASVMINQIPSSGVGLTWGWLVPCFFIISVTTTMAEMASSMPTAGGLYWWTYMFAPEKLKSYLSFLCGYSDSLGLIAGYGSINYGAAEQILASVTINSGYQPSRGIIFAVFVAICLFQVAVGFVPVRYVGKVQSASIALSFAAVVIVVVALPVGLKHKGLELNSGSFVFGDTSNYNNYPYGMSFLLAWMAPIWAISSQDSCVHLSEEVNNATTAVPIAMLMSVGLCAVLGFLIICVVTACMDPTSEGMTALLSADLPMANIIERALNKHWTVGIMSLFAFLQILMGLNTLLSTSRQVYAFARDDAFPFSKYIKQTTKNQLPIPALILSVSIAILISLLILAGNVAANAMFSLTISSLYLAWCLPIFAYAFSTKRLAAPGPFYLGHFFSKLNALVASFYGFFVIFGLGMIPSNVPVTDASGMNYACVLCGTVWLASSLYWLIDARKWYRGPRVTLEGDEVICENLEAEEWEKMKTPKAPEQEISSKLPAL